jgi:hypothetical protein
VVTSPLAVNTTYPIAGQAANYKLTVLNREPNRINFSHLGIMGKRIEDMTNADLYWATNSYIEPNTSFAIDVNVALSSAHYSEWPAMHIGNGYYNIYLDGTPTSRVNVLNLEVPGPEYAYKVTSPVTLSNQTPAIGETITASYEITNTSAVPATLSYVGVTNRLGGFYGAGADLGWKQNITIAAGATYPVNVSEIINTPGTYYYWAAYVLNGRMIYALPQTNQKTSGTFATHIPSLVVTSPLTVSPLVPLVGQQTTLAVTITNREPNRINYKRLGIQGFQIPSMVNADFEWLNNSYLDPGASINISRGWSLAAGQYSEWPAMSFGGGYYNVYRDGAPGSVSVANFTVYEQLPVLDGVSIPATSGLVGREQHLYLNAMEAVLGRTGESAALHYSDSGTPLAAQNGMAGGYGSFGSYAGNNLPVEDERYYINMRWNYVTWYEGADGSCSSNPDGHLDTCTTGASSSLKAWHYRKRVIVTNPATGKRVVASVLESGPAIWTGRVAGLSPEAMLALGANTNDNLTYFWAANQSLSVGPLN